MIQTCCGANFHWNNCTYIWPGACPGLPTGLACCRNVGSNVQVHIFKQTSRKNEYDLNILATLVEIKFPLEKLWNVWSSIGPAAPLTSQGSGLVLWNMQLGYYQPIRVLIGGGRGGGVP